MNVQRGSLWWAMLPDPEGSEPGYDRPVLVVQSDAINTTRINTVVAVIITRNLRLAPAAGNVLLSAEESGLPEDSVVNVSQIVTLNKWALNEYISDLSPRAMNDVDQGLRIVLDHLI